MKYVTVVPSDFAWNSNEEEELTLVSRNPDLIEELAELIDVTRIRNREVKVMDSSNDMMFEINDYLTSMVFDNDLDEESSEVVIAYIVERLNR